jgi:hypothetical protein
MARGVARYLVGSLVVLGLAACGKTFFAEREPWRHEAEVACLKSGQVKETASLIRVEPIAGPGICGADFPLKVSAIGEASAIGYADELRPPGGIPNARPVQPLANTPYSSAPYAPRVTAPTYQPYPQRQAYPPQPYPAQSGGAPMSIYAPGVSEPEAEPAEEEPEEIDQRYPQQAPYRPAQRAPTYQPYPQAPARPQTFPAQRMQPAEQIPLGRDSTPVATGAVNVQPTATLACPLVSQLDNWFASGVQPAAMRWFGVPVAEIKQISAYSCRGMNGQRGARISEHAFGNALDVASFTLADGRRVTVKDGWRGLPEEQGFLRDVHASACQLFSTVLAPGSNAFHYDHIHVDLMRRSSGRSICNPVAIPGDVVAARAGGTRFARGEPGVTGSVKTARKPSFRFMRGRDEVYDGLPAAVAGED